MTNSSHAAASARLDAPATPMPDDVAPEAFAALGQRDVVRVARDDHHVGEVRQPEHVLDGVDGQPDVGAVLAVGRGRKQLHQVDGAPDQLAAIAGVDLRRPVGVRAGEHQRPERRGEVDDGADVDGRPLEPLRIQPLGSCPAEMSCARCTWS